MSCRKPRIGGPLSEKELEVIALVAQDLADKQVADRLGCSQKTVEKHTQGARAKLGVRSRIGLTAWWLTEGQHIKPQSDAAPFERVPRHFDSMLAYLTQRGNDIA